MSQENTTTNEEEEEIVEIVEVEQSPHVIETGDSVKVKQVLDDTTMEAIIEAGYPANYTWENFKLLLMFSACCCAMLAQFYPMPFPASRPLLAACCAGYFIVSTILQFIVTFVDKDTIMFTKPTSSFPHELRIRTEFPRFQEYFTLTIEYKHTTEPKFVAKMYVGKYFTEKGEFDEEAFKTDVKQTVDWFVQKKTPPTVEFNHKYE